jgi:hypothetical protein
LQHKLQAPQALFVIALICVLGGAAVAWPFAVYAQQERMRRIPATAGA